MICLIVIITALSMNTCAEALSFCITASGTAKKFTITDTQAIFERPSGISAKSSTGFGEVNTNLNLQYKTAELILSIDKSTLTLRLCDCINPLTEAAKKLFPRMAAGTAALLELKKAISLDEYAFILNLFSNNYADIKRASFDIQFKFLDLLNVIQDAFPEIRSLIRMPWNTRILYAVKRVLWL
jgi:hypothetical protein